MTNTPLSELYSTMFAVICVGMIYWIVGKVMEWITSKEK